MYKNGLMILIINFNIYNEMFYLSNLELGID